MPLTLEQKIADAEKVLKLAAEMSEYYYHKPLIICYSGGKDSDVMLDIAKKCLNPNEFEIVNSHTTVDAPETVYHIRDVFKACEAEGIKTEIRMPRYKGEPTSMWKLIELKGMPPTRLTRYCCAYLKEVSTPNRLIAVGVRESEGVNRRNRDAFVLRGRKTADAEVRSLQHTYAMFQLDKLGQEDAYECKLIEACKKNKDTICNPIYKFTDDDIWDYIKINKLKINPLYARGYKRVGCIGCPMGGKRNQLQEFSDYPKYKENYIKAFERMKPSENNKRNLKSGEDWFNWWVGENPNQQTLF